MRRHTTAAAVQQWRLDRADDGGDDRCHLAVHTRAHFQ